MAKCLFGKFAPPPWMPLSLVSPTPSLKSFRHPCVREVTSFSGSSGSMDEYLTDLGVFVQ